MIKTYSVVFGIIIAINPLQAEVFKWTDSNGVVHFSDKEHPNAQKIELPSDQTYSKPAAIDTDATPGSSAPTPVIESPKEPSVQDPLEAAIVAPLGYKNVQIEQPKDQETLRNSQGFIPILVTTDPLLQKGDKIQVMLDGKSYGTPEPGNAFALKEIDRGTHTITVNVLNEKNEIIKTSAPVTIYLQRPRVGMVPGTRR